MTQFSTQAKAWMAVDIYTTPSNSGFGAGCSPYNGCAKYNTNSPGFYDTVMVDSYAPPPLSGVVQTTLTCNLALALGILAAAILPVDLIGGFVFVKSKPSQDGIIGFIVLAAVGNLIWFLVVIPQIETAFGC